jgi:TPR repeat protein
MLRQGMGVPENQAKARELYQKASDMGYAKASFNLAQMYKTAQGGKQDFAKAFEYAMKAEQKGYKSAGFFLGYS